MKRLLSLVLAISIMVSLFPAVSANEPVSEAAGIKVKYDLGGMLGKAGTVNGADGFGGEGYRGITRDLTNGFFEYAANKTDGKYSWNADGIEYATYTSANKTGTTRFRGANEKRGGLQLKTGTGNWWALKIYVPAEGVYTPKATYWRYNRAGKTYLDYFLIKDTGEEVSTLLAEENLTPESDGYIGSKRNEDTTIKGAQDYSYDEAF
ncbi:MAG: hypothetical protein IJ949_04290, partial [Oscillospiraceae bacterium]|nr:hypothetical protein [Oscillospiraceae bacterium]